MKDNLFEARFSDESIDALRKILGLSVLQIFSPGLDVEDAYISSPNFSIPLDGKGYVVIEIEWLETPKHYLDYYQISASFSRKPKGVSVGNEEGIGEVLNYPISSITLRPLSPVVKITIHEQKDSEDDESIAYDRTIIFHREDGGKFSISAHDSIADLLDFTKDKAEINSIIEDSICRIVLE